MQLRQVPQAMLNGTDTRSPTLIRLTAAPTSSTMPMFSWPRTLPSSTAVRPSYMCRSEPQMLVVVIRTIASVGSSIVGSGTSSTATLARTLVDDGLHFSSSLVTGLDSRLPRTVGANPRGTRRSLVDRLRDALSHR